MSSTCNRHGCGGGAARRGGGGGHSPHHQQQQQLVCAAPACAHQPPPGPRPLSASSQRRRAWCLRGLGSAAHNAGQHSSPPPLLHSPPPPAPCRLSAQAGSGLALLRPALHTPNPPPAAPSPFHLFIHPLPPPHTHTTPHQQHVLAVDALEVKAAVQLYAAAGGCTAAVRAGLRYSSAAGAAPHTVINQGRDNPPCSGPGGGGERGMPAIV